MGHRQPSRPQEAEPTPQTIQAHGEWKLSRLCEAIGFEAGETALHVFRLLAESWGNLSRDEVPEWRSDITDDHSPYEFSVAFDGSQFELRFLMEVQARPMTVYSSWAVGLATCERLHRELGTPLNRLRLLEDLFEPSDPEARFAMWHAVCFRPGDPPDVKIYLNPQARGLAVAGALVEEALERLGYSRTWRFLSREVLKPRDRLAYFSLDLSARSSARVKIYLAQPGITADEAERLMATDAGYAPGVATDFCRAVLGGDGPFDRRPGGTCFAFTEDRDDRPYSTTLHLPPRAYVGDDRQVALRIRQFLEPAHRDTLQAALEAVAGRPLEAGVGLIQWVSLKRRNGQNRVTTYISPEAYRVAPPRR